jgi:hypothetical protein
MADLLPPAVADDAVGPNISNHEKLVEVLHDEPICGVGMAVGGQEAPR